MKGEINPHPIITVAAVIHRERLRANTSPANDPLSLVLFSHDFIPPIDYFLAHRKEEKKQHFVSFHHYTGETAKS